MFDRSVGKLSEQDLYKSKALKNNPNCARDRHSLLLFVLCSLRLFNSSCQVIQSQRRSEETLLCYSAGSMRLQLHAEQRVLSGKGRSLEGLCLEYNTSPLPPFLVKISY